MKSLRKVCFLGIFLLLASVFTSTSSSCRVWVATGSAGQRPDLVRTSFSDPRFVTASLIRVSPETETTSANGYTHRPLSSSFLAQLLGGCPLNFFFEDCILS